MGQCRPIGGEIVAQSMDKIANAASVFKKFLDGKRPLSDTIAGGDTTNKTSVPSSVLYVGFLKARLSKTEGDGAGLKAIRSNTVMNTTVFLGKMISRKDKYGLIRGSDMAGEEEDSSRDNPLIAALEKVKLRQQSLDSDSRAASQTSHVR